MKKIIIATALLSVASMSFAKGSISQELIIGGNFSKSENFGGLSTVTKFDIENNFVKGNTELKEFVFLFNKDKKEFILSNFKNDYLINAKISEKNTLFANLKTQKIDETVFKDTIIWGVDLGLEHKFNGFNLKASILGRNDPLPKNKLTIFINKLGAKVEGDTEINGVKLNGHLLTLFGIYKESPDNSEIMFSSVVDGKLQAKASLGIFSTTDSLQLGYKYQGINDFKLEFNSDNTFKALENLDVKLNGGISYENRNKLSILNLDFEPGFEYKDNFLNNKLEVNADGSIAVDYENKINKSSKITLIPKASIMAGYKITENVTPYIKLAGEYKFDKELVEGSEAKHTGDFVGTLGVKYAW